MPKIKLMEEKEATGMVKSIFDEIKSTLSLSFVPQVFRGLAADPDELKLVWGDLKRFFNSGQVDMKTKGMAAVAMAAAQDCSYFDSMYSSAMKLLGVTDEQLDEMRQFANVLSLLNHRAILWELESEL